MSSALGIASVTAVLKNLLDNGLIDDTVVSTLGNVTVSARAPDLIPLDANAGSQLNLFLYHLTFNSGWRNVGQPARDQDYERRSNPPLALDLHYFLTAYAAHDLHAEILLGHGMQILHETPVLSRQGIRNALGVPGILDAPNGLPADLRVLAASNLAEQAELIKIVPQTMGTEEVSRLWSAFQSRYRPSAAYQVSVVLIAAQRPTRAPLPVRSRKVYVTPFQEPLLAQILVREGPTDPPLHMPVLARHTLVLRGERLLGEHTLVRISGIDVPVPVNARADEIAVAIPDGLVAGAQSVQVIHQAMMGEPPLPHAGVGSNLATFVLHPEIIAPPTLTSGVIRVTLDPPVTDTQEITLLLNERAPPTSPPADPRPPRAYSFVAPRRTTTSPSGPASLVDVPITGVTAGTYLVRVRVDGADSPLATDADGAYDAPVVVVP